jgi:hypothetical protein
VCILGSTTSSINKLNTYTRIPLINNLLITNRTRQGPQSLRQGSQTQIPKSSLNIYMSTSIYISLLCITTLNPFILIKRERIMAYYFFILATLFFVFSPLSLAQPFKAVNLGNWLVTEGWMKPSLYDGMPNNDLLVILFLTLCYSRTSINLYITHASCVNHPPKH